MSSDFSKPAVSDPYATLLTEINTLVNDLVKGFDPATWSGTPANLPSAALRWNSANVYWEKWNGTSWAAMATTYAINISGNAATVTNGIYTSNIASYAPSLTGSGASGTWGISVSGNAATATAPASGGSFITITNIGSQSVASAAVYTGTLAAIGAAARGANSDITSLGALTAVPSVVSSAIALASPPPIQGVGASIGSNALTVTYGGGAVSFRSSNLISGTPNQMMVSGLGLTVPSGATLGTVSGLQSQLILVLLYNGGAPALGIVNIAGGVNLDETTLISTTAISSGASSASTVYSPSAISSSPFRVIGEIVSTQTTAGTWATLPTLVQGCGGQAMAAMQSLGYGQTWQDVTASRASGTTYYNTTGRPIAVSFGATAVSGSPNLTVSIGGVQVINWTFPYGTANPASVIVPAGASYSATFGSGTGLAKWIELR